MADIASPTAICIASGIGATCLQAVATAAWPELSAYGVTGPALVWGGVGAYAGDMVRRMQARDAGVAPQRMTRGMWLVGTCIGGAGGRWAAGHVGGDASAVAGCSAFVGATWQWLVLALVPAVIDALKAVIARWAAK